MKKLIKNPIFMFILGIILSSSIVFAYSLIAPDVGFTPRDDTWDVDNTKDALDDLYRIITTGTIDNYDNKTYIQDGLQVYDSRVTILSGGYYIDAHKVVWVNLTFNFNRTFNQGTWLQIYGFPEMNSTDFITSDTTGKMAFRVLKKIPGDNIRYNRILYVGQEDSIYLNPTNTPVTIQFKYQTS